ncbi:fumarate hydratase [Methanococcoides sp. SA1]|nr:fumarate hydratase [Methanococcoides sp. SA1]
MHSMDGCNNQSVYSHIACCAQLGMILEVSSSPKPGNIDRHHDYEDTRYEHFLASAVSVHPVIEAAARNDSRVGALLKNAVCHSNSWQSGGNTHFGAFLLLIPLSMAAGELLGSGKKFDMDELVARAHEIVCSTDTDDAIDFYKAFRSAGVRVNDVDEFDLQDDSSFVSLREEGLTLYDLMVISQGYDQIANEWVSGFGDCVKCARMLDRFMDVSGDGALIPDINHAVVFSFLKLLSDRPDTFIRTKTDENTAEEVSYQAKCIVSKLESSGYHMSPFWDDVGKFDELLLEKGLNPGSTADIIIAGLFISLLGGLRF